MIGLSDVQHLSWPERDDADPANVAQTVPDDARLIARAYRLAKALSRTEVPRIVDLGPLFSLAANVGEASG